jgi:hypothetical protein
VIVTYSHFHPSLIFGFAQEAGAYARELLTKPHNKEVYHRNISKGKKWTVRDECSSLLQDKVLWLWP